MSSNQQPQDTDQLTLWETIHLIKRYDLLSMLHSLT